MFVRRRVQRAAFVPRPCIQAVLALLPLLLLLEQRQDVRPLAPVRRLEDSLSQRRHLVAEGGVDLRVRPRDAGEVVDVAFGIAVEQCAALMPAAPRLRAVRECLREDDLKRDGCDQRTRKSRNESSASYAVPSFDGHLAQPVIARLHLLDIGRQRERGAMGPRDHDSASSVFEASVVL